MDLWKNEALGFQKWNKINLNVFIKRNATEKFNKIKNSILKQ